MNTAIKTKQCFVSTILTGFLVFASHATWAEECLPNPSDFKFRPIYKNVDEFLNITKKSLNNEMLKKAQLTNFKLQKIDLNTGEGINFQDILKNIAQIYILNDRPFGKTDEDQRTVAAIIKIPVDTYHTLTLTEAHSTVNRTIQAFGKMSYDKVVESNVLISISPELIGIVSDHDNDGIQIYNGTEVIITNFYGVSFHAMVNLPNQTSAVSIGARSGMQLRLSKIKKINSPIPYLKIGIDGGVSKNKEGVSPAINPFIMFEVRM